MPGGRLITIEGVDGAGKSTLAAGLEAALTERGETVVSLREPGGVKAAERIRSVVTDAALRIDLEAEVLLFAAARAQLVREAVRPALEQGATVLLDRFVDSSLAYQGGGRGVSMHAIREVNAFATGGLRPERTLLLAVSPETGRARLEGAPDRMEQEDEAFFRRVADAYFELAEAEPERFVVIDASLPPDEVLREALAVV